MSERPFHHGNLRAVLLDQAEATLRAEGVDALSLRQLAREAGVSHGAPRRHFADRQALLDALAERGFLRLGEQVRAAVDHGGDEGADYAERLRAAATAYVRFAVGEPALLELMFTAKNAEPPAALQQAAGLFFTAVSDLIAQGVAAGRLRPGDPEGLQLLLVATLQGIAALVASGRLHPGRVDSVIRDAARLFTRDRHPDDVLPEESPPPRAH